MGDMLDHVHETVEGVASTEMTPPHGPRVDTPEYRKAHQMLVVEQDSPCLVCGVRASTLASPAHNPFRATALETHHYPIERSLVDACDPAKVGQTFKQVTDEESLQAFVDSPANLLVLCSVHHRSAELGIHHLLTQDWAIMPFLKDGYQIAATETDAASVEQADESIMKGVGGGMQT